MKMLIILDGYYNLCAVIHPEARVVSVSMTALILYKGQDQHEGLILPLRLCLECWRLATAKNTRELPSRRHTPTMVANM